MNNHSLTRQWIVVVLVLLIGAGTASAEVELQVGSGPNTLIGLVIIPSTQFHDSFKVRLYRESVQDLGSVTVGPQEGFRFRGLSTGVYYLEINVPGFVKVRREVRVGGFGFETVAQITLESQTEIVVIPPVDFSGEENSVINASDLEERPAHQVQELERAEEDLRNGDPGHARQRLEAIVREAPDFYDARKMLGAVYQKLERYRDAEVEYRSAKDLRPLSASPLMNLGSLYVQEAEASEKEGPSVVRRILNDAMENLLQAEKLNPGAPFVHYLLGVIYYKSSLLEDAEKSLIIALELEPRFAQARIALANVYVQMKDWPEALKQIDAYLEEAGDESARTQILKVRSQIERVLEAEHERVELGTRRPNARPLPSQEPQKPGSRPSAGL